MDHAHIIANMRHVGDCFSVGMDKLSRARGRPIELNKEGKSLKRSLKEERGRSGKKLSGEAKQSVAGRESREPGECK